MRYMVTELKKKDHIARGPLKPKHLEDLLNKHAADGWVLDRLMDSETRGFIGTKDVVLVIFRRDG